MGKQMEGKGIIPDEVGYNHMIGGLCEERNDEWQFV